MSEEKVRKKREPISDDKKKYTCEICGKKISNPSALKMHMRVHEKKPEEDQSFRKPEGGSEEQRGEDKDEGWVPF